MSKVTVSASMDSDLAAELKVAAERAGRSFSALVEETVRRGFSPASVRGNDEPSRAPEKNLVATPEPESPRGALTIDLDGEDLSAAPKTFDVRVLERVLSDKPVYDVGIAEEMKTDLTAVQRVLLRAAERREIHAKQIADGSYECWRER